MRGVTDRFMPPLRPTRIHELQAAVAPALALLAGMELDVFSAIGDETRPAADIAERLGVGADRLERLLFALTLAGLLEFNDGGFRNGAEARNFLVRGRPGFMGNEHELQSELWRADLSTAVSVRTGRPAAKHDFSVADEASSSAFFRGLVPNTLAFGHELAGVANFGGFASVVDIGGGPGAALWALGEHYPHLRLTLLELPAGIRLARRVAEELSPTTSVDFEEGDFVRAPSATTHDAAILKAVVQVLGRDDAAAVIRNAFASLNPNGMLFISGVGILDDDRLSPAHAVFYDLTFMNLYDAGQAYTRTEYTTWLSTAGFADISFAEMPSGGTLISARRP